MPAQSVGSSVADAPRSGGTSGERALEAPDWKRTVTRRRLFYPLEPLPTRGVADKSVQRIKERLALNAILNKDGKRIAYIYIKGLGVKACEERAGSVL